MRNSPFRFNFVLHFILHLLLAQANMASKSGSSAFQCFTTSSSASDTTYQSHYGISTSDNNALLSQLSVVAAPILRSIRVDAEGETISQEAPPLFVRDCNCEFDWADAFCLRADHYRRVDPIDAPTICICRQLGEVGNCQQFITRCFLDSALLHPGRKQPPTSTLRRLSTGASGRRRKDSCSCCLNQPDEYCQLDCVKMHPDFGREARNSTSCVCYDQSNYPLQICSPSSTFFKNLPNGARSDKGRSAVEMDVFERWSEGVTPLEQVVAITLRPSSSTRPVSSNPSTDVFGTLRSLPVESPWLLLTAITVLTMGIACLGLLLLQRRRRSARNKDAMTRDGTAVAADEVAELRPLTDVTAPGSGQYGTAPRNSNNSPPAEPNISTEQQLFV